MKKPAQNVLMQQVKISATLCMLPGTGLKVLFAAFTCREVHDILLAINTAEACVFVDKEEQNQASHLFLGHWKDFVSKYNSKVLQKEEDEVAAKSALVSAARNNLPKSMLEHALSYLQGQRINTTVYPESMEIIETTRRNTLSVKIPTNEKVKAMLQAVSDLSAVVLDFAEDHKKSKQEESETDARKGSIKEQMLGTLCIDIIAQGKRYDKVRDRVEGVAEILSDTMPRLNLDLVIEQHEMHTRKDFTEIAAFCLIAGKVTMDALVSFVEQTTETDPNILAREFMKTKEHKCYRHIANRLNDIVTHPNPEIVEFDIDKRTEAGRNLFAVAYTELCLTIDLQEQKEIKMNNLQNDNNGYSHLSEMGKHMRDTLEGKNKPEPQIIVANGEPMTDEQFNVFITLDTMLFGRLVQIEEVKISAKRHLQIANSAHVSDKDRDFFNKYQLLVNDISNRIYKAVTAKPDSHLLVSSNLSLLIDTDEVNNFIDFCKGSCGTTKTPYKLFMDKFSKRIDELFREKITNDDNRFVFSHGCLQIIGTKRIEAFINTVGYNTGVRDVWAFETILNALLSSYANDVCSKAVEDINYGKYVGAVEMYLDNYFASKRMEAAVKEAGEL